VVPPTDRSNGGGAATEAAAPAAPKVQVETEGSEPESKAAEVQTEVAPVLDGSRVNRNAWKCSGVVDSYPKCSAAEAGLCVPVSCGEMVR
jgi:hypothetical protein